VPGVLVQLEGFAVAWRRWSDRFADADDGEVKVRPADLPGEVQAAMAKVTKAFKAVIAAVAQEQEKSDRKDYAVTRKRR
jgi:surfactin synthase thioesterase subunit